MNEEKTDGFMHFMYRIKVSFKNVSKNKCKELNLCARTAFFVDL